MEEDNKTTIQDFRHKTIQLLRGKVDNLNTTFNKMSLPAQRLTMLSIGLLMAAVCLLALADGINPSQVNPIVTDSILRPNIQPMEKQQDTTELIPLGKLKGEINGEFTAFYVAMDRKGNFFKNESPSYSKDRWIKSDNWKQLSYREFKEYEKQLHFLPIEGKTKSLKR